MMKGCRYWLETSGYRGVAASGSKGVVADFIDDQQQVAAQVSRLCTEEPGMVNIGLSEWSAPGARSGHIGSQSGFVQVQVSAYSVGVL